MDLPLGAWSLNKYGNFLAFNFSKQFIHKPFFFYGHMLPKVFTASKSLFPQADGNFVA